MLLSSLLHLSFFLSCNLFSFDHKDTRKNRKNKKQRPSHIKERAYIETMRVFSTILCLVAAASFDVTKAEEIAILEDTPEARLIKDHDPIAEATYHESDPVVQDAVGSDNLPRLVRNRGPLTKKVVASGSHFPGLDFSL